MEIKLKELVGEAHSHDYFMTHPEPKVIPVAEILKEVTIDISKYTSEQLYHMFKHTHEQDCAVIEEQNLQLEKFKKEVSYLRNMLRRNKNAKINDRLSSYNNELEDKLEGVKQLLKEVNRAISS